MSEKNLELSEKNKIKGHIYLITNTKNGKKYVGQAVSHRKNKNKYRYFGYIGRFNDHVSEAINNTKKNQCTYLNNAIRKYGKQDFSIELITECELHEMDELEQEYIYQCNSLYPNGYNLTKGGKTLENIKVENNENLNKPKKRGRDFGYVHKDSTKAKIKNFLSDKTEIAKRKTKMSDTMIDFYDKKKIDILSKLHLDEDIKKYICPVKNKITNELHDYIIRVNGKKLRCATDMLSLEQKYDRLEKILKEAYSKCNNDGKNC